MVFTLRATPDSDKRGIQCTLEDVGAFRLSPIALGRVVPVAEVELLEKKREMGAFVRLDQRRQYIQAVSFR